MGSVLLPSFRFFLSSASISSRSRGAVLISIGSKLVRKAVLTTAPFSYVMSASVITWHIPGHLVEKFVRYGANKKKRMPADMYVLHMRDRMENGGLSTTVQSSG